MQEFFRVDGLLYRICSKVWGLMILNFLMILTSLPIITVGAMQTASFTVLTKMIKENETKIIPIYWTSFKKNLKQSTIVWIVLLPIIYLLIIDWIYLIQFKQLGKWFVIGAIIATLLVANVSQFIFFYLSRFADSLKNTVINIIKIFFSKPITSFVLLILMYSPILLMFLSSYLFVFNLFIGIFIGLSFNLFLRTYLMLIIFKKYE